MSTELKGKMKGCMSENEMFLQWGELRKGERSYQAEITRESFALLKSFVKPLRAKPA